MAALLPAFILLVWVYRQDKIEPEPPGMIISLIFLGVLAALCSIVLEMIGERVLPNFLSTDSPYYQIASAFLVVAAVEEGTKYFFLKKRSWRDSNFNYRFDGIVYAVSVSLGFAGFENLEYVFGYGLSVAPSRALLSIPGHLSFAIFMGTFYGSAKLWANQGKKFRSELLLWFGYLSAVFFHGFYDSCLMIGTSGATALFILFVIAMYVLAFFLLRHESRRDRPV